MSATSSKTRPPYHGTDVPVGRSGEAIRKLLRDYEAERIVVGETWEQSIAVEWGRRSIRYRMELPAAYDDDAEERRLWRVLYWTVKAKVESVDAGLETYEIAFLGAIVDPGSGATLSKIVLPMIEAGHFDESGSGLAALPRST